MNRPNIKMIVTDLDGTLLNDKSTISDENLQTLGEVGNKNIIRVFATGRSLYGVFKVFDRTSPFDYIVFSTGGGIYQRETNDLIFSQNIKLETVNKITELLDAEKENYCVTMPIPFNHKYYIKKHYEEEDFNNRNLLWINHIKDSDIEKTDSAAQIIVIFPKYNNRFDILKEKILNVTSEVNIIKSTSPISKNNIWLEVYPAGISKATGVEKIAALRNISREEILGVGNDYNDIDFLDYCETAYVTNNSPHELQKKYKVTKSNNDNGFSQAVRNEISLNK